MFHLHEYQAKAVFESYGLPVLDSFVAGSPTEARDAAARLSTEKVVVKAQIQAEGRGHVGGVKLVDTPREAADYAESILGTHLVTDRTGKEGLPVHSVLVEAMCDIAKEFHLSMAIDEQSQRLTITMSVETDDSLDGAIHERRPVSLAVSLGEHVTINPEQSTRLGIGLGMSSRQFEQLHPLLNGLGRLITDRQLTRIDIDPLVLTDDHQLICLNPKIRTGRTLTSY